MFRKKIYLLGLLTSTSLWAGEAITEGRLARLKADDLKVESEQKPKWKKRGKDRLQLRKNLCDDCLVGGLRVFKDSRDWDQYTAKLMVMVRNQGSAGLAFDIEDEGAFEVATFSYKGEGKGVLIGRAHV